MILKTTLCCLNLNLSYGFPRKLTAPNSNAFCLSSFESSPDITTIGISFVLGAKDNRLEKLAYNARVLAQSLSFLPKYENYISEDYLETIEVAALLHDIGKITSKNCNKSEKFEHAERGAKILEGVLFGVV